MILYILGGVLLGVLGTCGWIAVHLLRHNPFG